MGRPLQAQINLSALLHNLKRVKEITNNRHIIAMIKANAYGHGIFDIANVLSSVQAFGVANIEEAIELRQAGIKNRIIVIGGFISYNGLKNIYDWQLESMVHQPFQVDLMERYANNRLKVWIKINTGMNRLGFSQKDFINYFPRIEKSCEIKGIMTHFSDADSLSSDKTSEQIKKFNEVMSKINKKIPYSLANSAAILQWPESYGDYVRPGLMLYGVSPFKDKFAASFNLKPVMTLKAKLMAIQQVNKGESIGYTSRYISSEDMLIGVVSIGYADGYTSLVPDGTPVLLNNKKTKIIGKISMDITTIDLRDHKDAKIGDDVILWGDGLPVEEIANSVGIIPYELLTSVGNRVKRTYVYNNEYESKEICGAP